MKKICGSLKYTEVRTTSITSMFFILDSFLILPHNFLKILSKKNSNVCLLDN